MSHMPNFEIRLFIGENIPNSKVKSASDLSGVDHVKLPTIFLKIGRRVLPYHTGLISQLRKYKPDVIICEGESNILSYIKAIIYKLFIHKVKIIHWSLGGLPGKNDKPISSFFKKNLQKFFDGFICYSSYGKLRMQELGHDENKIFVATNVCDTDTHLGLADSVVLTRKEARSNRNLPEAFTALYVGAIDQNKNLDTILNIAKQLDSKKYTFLIIGDGPVLSQLKQLASDQGLENIIFTGRVTEGLDIYYRASDVLLLPGRGGMVISEAMCYGLPAIAYEADGTEYDLVRDNETGIRIKTGEASEFSSALEKIRSDTDFSQKLGENARKVIENQFSTNCMLKNIERCIGYVVAEQNIQK
jgi:glycosyltransferase involved in cell wall biosynthesis